jgi:hypothetical protein
VILGSRATGGAPFYFHLVSGTNIRLDCLGRSFLSSSIGLGRVPIVTDLNDVFCFVLTVFLVILGSTAAEGAVFSFNLVVGTGVRLDLRRIMLEDRAYGPVPPKNEKKVAKARKTAPRTNILGTLIEGYISLTDGIRTLLSSSLHPSVLRLFPSTPLRWRLRSCFIRYSPTLPFMPGPLILHRLLHNLPCLCLHVRNRRALPRSPRREEVYLSVWPCFGTGSQRLVFTLLLGLPKVLLVDRLLLRALLARGSHHCALFVRQTPIGCCVSDILNAAPIFSLLFVCLLRPTLSPAIRLRFDCESRVRCPAERDNKRAWKAQQLSPHWLSKRRNLFYNGWNAVVQSC